MYETHCWHILVVFYFVVNDDVTDETKLCLAYLILTLL